MCRVSSQKWKLRVPLCICEMKTKQPEESARPNRPGEVSVIPVDQGSSRGENKRINRKVGWSGVVCSWQIITAISITQCSVTSFFKIKTLLHSLTKPNSCTLSLEYACDPISVPEAWYWGLCWLRENDQGVENLRHWIVRISSNMCDCTWSDVSTFLKFSNTDGSSSNCETGDRYLSTDSLEEEIRDVSLRHGRLRAYTASTKCITKIWAVKWRSLFQIVL